MLGDRPYWCFCVETLQGADGQSQGAGKKRIDDKDVLSSEDFAVFVALRDLRKTIADAEAVPVFTIFTNEQLADIARNRPTTVKELTEIAGIGRARTDRYGEAVIELVAAKAGNPDEELARSGRSDTHPDLPPAQAPTLTPHRPPLRWA